MTGTLGSSEIFAKKIDEASTKVVRALHKIIYNGYGSKNARLNIKKFSGFTFNGDSAEFTEKVEKTENELTQSEVYLLCDFFEIECEDDSDKSELITKLLGKLMDVAITAISIDRRSACDDGTDYACDDRGQDEEEGVNDDIRVQGNVEPKRPNAWRAGCINNSGNTQVRQFFLS